jgi:hypothetical protein
MVSRRPSDSLQPVIWDTRPYIESSKPTFSSAWVNQATTRSESGYTWMTNIWLWFACLGPLFHIISANMNMRPRQARNYIFRRLCKRYVPSKKTTSILKRLLFTSIIWLRYLYIFVRFFCPELYICEELVKLLLYAIRLLILLLRRIRSMSLPNKYPAKGVRTPKFPGFHDFLVLQGSNSKARHRFAKTLAIAWFFTAYIGCLTYIGIVTLLVVKAELSIRWVPESESKKAVGQWSTWATLGLGIVASIIVHYRKLGSYRKAPINLSTMDLEDASPHLVALYAKKSAESEESLKHYLMACAIYEWEDFKYWWHNTIEASAADEDKKTQALKDEVYVWDTISASCEDGGSMKDFLETHILDREALGT